MDVVLFLWNSQKRVADELELDYIPSAFCVRCAYVKGMVFVVDFKQYAAEYGITEMKDLYGNLVDITKTDMILTKSQFKLWNAYDSIQEYDKLCEENGFCGELQKLPLKQTITVFVPIINSAKLIDLTNDDDVAELCDPTVKWLNGISIDDPNQAILFLLGKLCDKDDIDFNNILT